MDVVLELPYESLLHLRVNVKNLSILGYILGGKSVALYLENPCIHKPSIEGCLVFHILMGQLLKPEDKELPGRVIAEEPLTLGKSLS